MESRTKEVKCDRCDGTGKYLQGSVIGFNDETEQEEEEFWWEPCDCMYETAPTSAENGIYIDDKVVPKINNIDKGSE